MTRAERTLSWARSDRSRRIIDIAGAMALALLGLIGHAAATNDPSVEAAPLGPVIALLAMAAPAVILPRRTRPMVMLLALFGIGIVAGAVAEGGLFSLQFAALTMVLCFAIGSWSPKLRANAIAIAAVLVLALLVGLAEGAVVATVTLFVALLAFPLVLGIASRVRRDYLAEVELRLAEAERDRDARARTAIVEERNRIARELHDVVAHHVSLIGVLAGAARTTLASDPDKSRSNLEAIEAASREAVGEMRQLLGVLRDETDVDPAPPEPQLDRVAVLATTWADAGLAVTATIDVDPATVPPALSTALFRVVEEALTNVTRHSTATTVAVDLRRIADDLVLRISDPGPSKQPSARPDSRGILGMSERVQAFDGKLVAGPTGRGFKVRVTVPAPVTMDVR